MTRFWQVLVIALGIAVAAAMVVMGFWQLEVYHNQGQAAAERRAAAPPVPLSSVARAGAPVKDGYGRSVTFEGSYDPACSCWCRWGTAISSGYSAGCGRPTGVWWRWYAASSSKRQPHRRRRAVRFTRSACCCRTRGTCPGDRSPSGQIASVRLPALAQQWPGPLIDGFVTLSSADAARQELAPASGDCPRRAAGCAMGRTRCSGGCSPRSPSLWRSG